MWAVFGEVYPDSERVVQVVEEGRPSFMEFCGRTHISNTADAEAFVLTEETAVAKGIRRITVLMRAAARRAVEGAVAAGG